MLSSCSKGRNHAASTTCTKVTFHAYWLPAGLLLAMSIVERLLLTPVFNRFSAALDFVLSA